MTNPGGESEDDSGRDPEMMQTPGRPSRAEDADYPAETGEETD